MINEDYVSFELAKLLKEKGFDEVCYRMYDTKEKELWGRMQLKYQKHLKKLLKRRKRLK